jgi:hypothetical protein
MSRATAFLDGGLTCFAGSGALISDFFITFTLFLSVTIAPLLDPYELIYEFRMKLILFLHLSSAITMPKLRRSDFPFLR